MGHLHQSIGVETSAYIQCWICERRCRIYRGKTGGCGKYTFDGSDIIERAPNRFLTVCPISMETMPILHFHPRAKVLQITTTGCNFDCDGCVSNIFVKEMNDTSKALRQYSADEIVARAIDADCVGIAFVMNDPLASLFTFLEIAQKAKAKRLLVGCATNGYFTKTSLVRLGPFLDFVNIGMKGFSDTRYRSCGAWYLSPVLENVAMLRDMGVHLEISPLQQNLWVNSGSGRRPSS